MAGELDAQDVGNILNLLGRVELKGSEAHAFVTAEMKLKMLLKNLQDAEPPKKEDTDKS